MNEYTPSSIHIMCIDSVCIVLNIFRSKDKPIEYEWVVHFTIDFQITK